MQNVYQEQRNKINEKASQVLNSVSNNNEKSVVKLIRDLSLFYCDYSEKENLEFIEEYVSKHKSIDGIKSNEKYEIMFKCIALIRALSELKDLVYVNLINGLHKSIIEQGFDSYDAWKYSFEIFDIEFDENNSPILTINDSAEFNAEEKLKS